MDNLIYFSYQQPGLTQDISPDGKKFFGGWRPQDSYKMDVLWVNKDDVSLLKNFDPIGPPPNLMAKTKTKAD
ncbi:hypothetical protein [Methylosarcina fibrata]|uniref:hypothetical protein n=1 Tax=Methylosarcina fibrata TaxID=105972 RepID=UPI00036831F7|nr:hypothetical protein [Methylosarcina fibrata]